jgi:hypothetical protein
VFVTRDEQALYVAWRCVEPLINKLRVDGAKRDDQVWTGDCVELFVTPEPSGRTYYHFVLNPRGILFDELNERFGREKSVAWNAEWEGAARIGKGEWTAEMRIPFAAVGLEPKPGCLFAISACRQRMPEKEWQANSATFGGFHTPQHFALAHFGKFADGALLGVPTLRAEGEQLVARSFLSVGKPARGRLRLKASLCSDGGRHTVASQRLAPVDFAFPEFVITLPDEVGSASLVVEVRSGDELLDAAAISFKPPRTPPAHVAFGALLARLSSCAVWTASATRKVHLDQPLPETVADGIEIAAARNDTEAFQIVLTPTATLSDVRVDCSSFVPPRGWGRGIASRHVTVRRVGYVPVTRPTDRRGYEGMWPDPLLPITSPPELEPGRHHTFWLTVYVPKGAPAGIHTAQLTVSAGGNVVCRVPVRLRVFDFTLPDEPRVRTAYGLGFGSVCQWQGLKTDADKRMVAGLYLDDFMRHRVSPYGPLWPDWYKLTVKGDDFEIDFSAFDAAAKRTLDARHFNGFNYGWGGTSVPAKLGDRKRFTPEYNKLHQRIHHTICEHFKKNGWLHKAYVYWFDEPREDQYDYVVKGMKLLRAAHPEVQRLLTEQPEEPLYGHVDIWCPVLSQYDRTQELCKERQRLGDQVWWYVCCGPRAPYPNNFTDHPAVTHRIRFWMLWKHRVQGSLYWSTTYWRTNPWKDAASIPPRGGFWGNGDGYLVFPPVREKSKEPVLSGPIDTIRWELIREGLEDIEWLYTLEERLSQASWWRFAARSKAKRALRAARRLVPSFTDYEMDPEKLYAVRLRIGEAIERLGKPKP